MVSVNRFGFQSSLFRFGRLVKIEIGNRAEEIGIRVAYSVQLKRATGQVQNLIPFLLASRDLRQAKDTRASNLDQRSTPANKRYGPLLSAAWFRESDPALPIWQRIRVDFRRLPQVLLCLRQFLILQGRAGVFILLLSPVGNLQARNAGRAGHTWKLLNRA